MWVEHNASELFDFGVEDATKNSFTTRVVNEFLMPHIGICKALLSI